MNISVENLKPGDSFKLFGERYHFVGAVQDDEIVYVCWIWNEYKRRRVYVAFPDWQFRMRLEYAKK